MTNFVYLDIETTAFFGDPELASMPREAQIMAIPFGLAVMMNGQQVTTWWPGETDELWSVLCHRANTVVGFNVQQFDLPIIYRAADLSVPAWPRVIDIFEQIKLATGRWAKLDDVAMATLGRRKTADGKQAAQWLRDGETDKVIAYCREDVQLVKDLHEVTLRGEPLVLPPLLTKYKQEHEIRLWLDEAGQWSRYEVRR